MSTRHRNNLLVHCIVICATLLHGPVSTVVAKGPHHPGGEFSRKADKHHLDEHLQPEREHLQDDLKRLPIGEQSLTEMSEDEKNFYYFKLHDSDNNDNLDGLEMLHAATHHHSKSDGQLHGIDRASTHNVDDQVIDDFIEFADTDKNGLLNYPEYINAINLNDLKTETSTVDNQNEPHTHAPSTEDGPFDFANKSESNTE
uniref:EF-hand domain-containing protein n=1 Tax=Anopheles christyi TaxID=43041 RepID=A0A182K634_9DIPT